MRFLQSNSAGFRRILFSAAISGGLALALSVYGDPDLVWDWLPLLVLPVIAEGSKAMLPWAFASIEFVRPREALFQRGLSRALFWLLADTISPKATERVLFYLRQAERYCTNRNALQACARFRDRVQSGRQDATVEDRAAFLPLLTRDQPRSPNYHRKIWLRKWNSTIALAISGSFAAGLAISVGEDRLGFDDAAQVLAVLHVCMSSLALAYDIWFRCRLVWSEDNFHTVIVTDQNPKNAVLQNIRELYWRVGRVTMICVASRKKRDDDESGDRDSVPIEWEKDGNELYLVYPEDLPAALEFLILSADLLVVAIDNEATGTQVLEATSLPWDRRLSLNPGDRTLPGFQRIEPTAITSDLARMGPPAPARPRLTRYDRSMPQGSQHWLTDLWILSATALLWAEGSVLVCVLVLLVAISHRLQIWYGIRRRERASPTVLRTPRHPGYSARFSPKKLQRRLSVASFVLTSLAWLPIIWTYWDRATDNGSLLFLVLISGFVLAAIGAQFGLRTGGLRLVKWWLDRDFRIVVFRRNSPKNVYAHLLLMAACGRYGQSIALNDETLEQADKGFLTGRAKSEGEWFRIFAEQDHQIEMDVLRTDWQRTVLSELEFADFAVFDWVETVTEAMIWELEMSALNLPAHRVLVLASAETLPLVHMAFSRLDATYVAKVTCVEVNREYDEGFIWKSHRAFIAEVDNTLARLMAKLGRESREVRVMAMTGAWPLPTC